MKLDHGAAAGAPDLDRAREAARGIFHAAYYGRALPDTVVRLILEQRAEEAERAQELAFARGAIAKEVRLMSIGRKFKERTADLRRQARAALTYPETGATHEAKKK